MVFQSGACILASVTNDARTYPARRSNQNQGMLKRVDHEASFLAEDDTGRTYWLDVFVDVLDVGTNDNPHAERKGLREIKTRTGQFLNRLEKGKYKLIHSGRILSSTDPDAV